MKGVKGNHWLVHNEITDTWEELVLSRGKLIERLLQTARGMELHISGV